MFRLPDPPPMATRVAADEPITVALLAAVSGEALELSESFLETWLMVAHAASAAGTIVVFDTFVLGRPDPFLREVAHQLRLIRRAEARGDYDDEEERFYEEHEDDEDAYFEPPTIAERTVAALRHLPDSNRLLDDGFFSSLVWAAHGLDMSNWFPHHRLERAMQRLVVELADAIHFDGAVAIDGRLAGQRVDSLRWAA